MSAVTKVVRAASRSGILLAVLALMVTAATWPRPRAARWGSAVMERVVTARLTEVPSHNRLFRASLELTSDSVWMLRLRSASGAPVQKARVELDAWMPEHGMPEQQRVARAIVGAPEYWGAGRYRVLPLTLDRPGWWNIHTQISVAGRTDSLAFNVILR